MDGINFVDVLPKELSEEIFSYLHTGDLRCVALCCKRWRNATNVDIIWFHQCLIRGWVKFGLKDSLLATRSLCPMRTNVSGKSPKFSFSVPKNSTLSPLSKWHEVFLQAKHLKENWRNGRYSVAPICRGHMEKITALDSNAGLVSVAGPLVVRSAFSASADLSSLTLIAFESTVVISGSGDTTMKIWNIHSSQCKFTSRDHSDTITAVRLRENTIVTGCADGKVRIFDLQSRKLKFTLSGHKGGVDHLQFDGNIIVTAGSDRTVRVWSGKHPCLEHTLTGHLDEIECLVAHRKLAVTGSWDRTLMFWDLDQGILVHTLKDHTEVVTCVDFNTRRIVSGSADGTLRLWATTTGRCKKVMKGHTGEVYCVAYGEGVIASGSSDSTVIVWTDEGVLLHRMEEHLGVIRCIHLDGDKLVTGGDAKKIVVWDYLRGKQLNVVHRHPTLLHLMWINDTKIITASPQQPGTLTILSYW